MKRFTKLSLERMCTFLVVVMVVSIMSAMSFVSTTAASGNLLALNNLDPSFEATVFLNTIQSDVDKVTGTYSMSFLGESGQIQKFYNPFATNPILPNYQYTLSAYVKQVPLVATAENYFTMGINIATSETVNGRVVSKSYLKALDSKATSTFVLISLTFISPKTLGKFDPYNEFFISFTTQEDVLIDDMSLVEVGPAPTPTPKPPVADSVKINPVTEKSTVLSGITSPGSRIFTLKYGTTSKEVASAVSGLWMVKLSKPLVVGTKITLTSNTVKTLYIPASAPTVNPITSKSKTISGKTYKSAAVTIKVGSKPYSLKANSKGVFSQKLTTTLKKGTKVMVRVKASGQTSPYKTVTVK